MKLELHNTENPISNAERLKLNENWQRIISGYSYLQQQVKVLAGGKEVDELLQRLNDAVESANKAVQQAIDTNKKSTQEALEANNTALQQALNTVSQTLDGMKKTIADANTATTEANAAIQGALDATAQAQEAVTSMQSLINNMNPRGIWNDKTHYYKNNLVFFNGSTFIALQNNLGKTPPALPNKSNAYWSLFAEKGATGERGPRGERGADGKNGKDGTGINIIGELRSEDDRPSTGSPGDAYMIKGNLHVWQVNTNGWKNVGPIQGPQGKSAYELFVENGFQGTMQEWIESLKGSPGSQGPEGPPGPPGETPDLSNLNQEMSTLQTRVNEHIQKATLHHYFVQGKQDDNGIYQLTIPGISKYVRGLQILLEPTENNKQGKVKFNINGLGAKDVSFQNRQNEGGYINYIEAPDTLQSNKVYEFIYNGRDFNVIGMPFITDYPEFAFFDNATVSAKGVRRLTETKANKELPNSIQCTLNTGWSHANDSASSPLTYYKDGFGIVHLQGTIEKSGTPLNSELTTLPVGFKPTTKVSVGCVGHKTSNSSDVPIIIGIDINGRVVGGFQMDSITIACSFRTT